MKALILEDSLTAQRDLKILLENLFFNTEIFVCSTYDQAIKCIESHAIHYAFVELQIPVKNGADFIMDVKSQQDHHGLKLIAVTGTGENSLLKTSLESVVDGYLQKPVDLVELKKILDNFRNNGRSLI